MEELDEIDTFNLNSSCDFKEMRMTYSTTKKERLESKVSSSSTDSGISLRLSSSVSCLISDVDTSGCTVAEVPWQVSRADLVIKVGSTLIAVHRSLVSLYSDILKNIIQSVSFVDEDAPVVTLMEQIPDKILLLLTHIYFLDKDVTDNDVEGLAMVAFEFGVDMITCKCENFLIRRSQMPPMHRLKIGTQCGMKRLVECMLLRVSKLPGVLKLLDEENLCIEIENKLLRLVLARNEKCPFHDAMQGAQCCFWRRNQESKPHSGSPGLDDDLSDSSDDEFESDDEYVYAIDRDEEELPQVE
eukprot:gene17774-19550_t